MDDDQKIQESLEKLRSAYEQFVFEIEVAQREHGERINEIIRRIEARKIEKLREELNTL